jgi:hypothetical protein
MTYADLMLEEHREPLMNAGYDAVPVFEEYDKGWVCAVSSVSPRSRDEQSRQV